MSDKLTASIGDLDGPVYCGRDASGNIHVHVNGVCYTNKELGEHLKELKAEKKAANMDIGLLKISLEQAHDQIKTMAEFIEVMQLKSPWVLTSERLPTKDDAPTGEVLWAKDDPYWRETNSYDCSKEYREDIGLTRWMPIPPIPDTPE